MSREPVKQVTCRIEAIVNMTAGTTHTHTREPERVSQATATAPDSSGASTKSSLKLNVAGSLRFCKRSFVNEF